jgi:UDP:flavonoid glycosyltransferase YjiC (YdhE family)
MRITMIAAGSRGDFQPYLALSRGLAGAGHQLRVATHEEFRAEVEEQGLEYAPVGANPRQMLEEDVVQEWVQSGRNFVGFFRRLAEVLKPKFEELWRDCLAAAGDAEAILYSPLGFPGYHLAEYLQVPSAAALTSPTIRTRAFPSAVVPPPPRMSGAAGNLVSHAIAEQLFWWPFARLINSWRTEIGLEPIGKRGLQRHLLRERHPALFGFSPAVLPKPRDWGDFIHVTGYWFLDPPAGYAPDPELEVFLADGPPPVYIGFGSMRPSDPDEATRAIVTALERTEQRGLIEPGWGGIGEIELPDGVRRVDAPHAWLLPRVAAVVHHGGAGTTGAGLRAGCPTVICPFFGDQLFWGERVRELGVGPRPIPQRKLDAERLTAALELAKRPDIREGCAALGEQIRAEDGVARAVELFDGFVRSQPPPGHRRRPSARSGAGPARPA